MKVVLFSVPIMDQVGDVLLPIGQDCPPSCPSLAIYQLAAILRKEGHDVAIADMVAQGSLSLEPFLGTLREADLLAISATSLSWPALLAVTGKLRAADVSAPIVIGGVHATMFPDYILRTFPAIDFVIRHEGDRALGSLCAALASGGALAGVPNLTWRSESGEIVQNAEGPALTVTELAGLPVPAYDLLPPGIYSNLSLQSSRGCPFNCSFCSTSYRKSYRGIPPAAFVDSLEAVLAFGEGRVLRPEVIQIADDEWSLDRQRSIDILREVERRGLPVRFIYDSRANDFLGSEEFIGLMAPRTEGFLIGAECGYDEGLLRIGKGTTTAKLKACARRLEEYGIADKAEFSFILGLPWEGKQEVLRTVQFASRIVVEHGVTAIVQWYCQIPGSLLWDDSYMSGIVTPAMYNDFGFFRNLYLFRTSVKLDPDSIWEVMEVIQTCHSLAVLSGRDRACMLYRPPAQIELNFPRSLPRPSAANLGSTPLVATRRKPGQEAVSV